MKHLYAFLLLVFVATSATARIISYSPYSDRISRAAHHERNTRWFLVIEDRELVLYDSAGAHEPRVVPFPDGLTRVTFAALYESKKGVDAPPIILLDHYLSIDGGASWQMKLRWDVIPAPPRDFDTGGPFVQGLSSSILPGTDEIPFVLGDSRGNVWMIPVTGAAILMEEQAQLVGRNAAGDRFLIRKPTDIRIAGLNGYRDVVMPIPRLGHYTGWITADGSAYIVAARFDGRYLSFHRKTNHQFIAGPPFAEQRFDASLAQFPEMNSFAIPTHDFSGAWIIQRGWNVPTTLLRHTRADGLQTMWSDPSRPEVEALIAGASGDTLLVQVHRDRAMPEGEALLRIDPALAVWRVGDPMPAEYDELYLSEGWDKGFVHVDVDRLAAGDPFVFNSGERLGEEEESDFSSGIGGGDIVQEWGVVRGSLKQHLVLPGVARAQGAFGSRWFTDVTIHNPFDEAQALDIRFAAMAEENVGAPLAGRTLALTLAPHEIRVLEDVLQSFGVENGGGTLHILPAKTVDVNSRTYSRSGEGTYGFGMYALDFFTAAGPRFPLSFAGAFAGEHFRTNVLLTDTSGRGAEAELRAYRGLTAITGDRAISAPAGGTAQFNGVKLQPDGPVAQAQKSGALVVQTKRGTTIPMVIAIDNRTNDATYLPPDVASEVERVIPVIGHVDGAGGSRFRSDLYLFNGAATGKTVQLQAILWNDGATRQVSFSLAPFESRVVPDALMTLFGMSGLAQLRYETMSVFGEANAGGVRVTSRTYNVDANGATSGCLIPRLNAFHAASADERLEIITAIPDGFRVNLGLVNVDEDWLRFSWTMDVEIFDETGRLIRWLSPRVPMGGGMQINDLFAATGAPRAARIVVRGPATFAAYVTLTDNVTNDTLYLPGQLGAKPD